VLLRIAFQTVFHENLKNNYLKLFLYIFLDHILILKVIFYNKKNYFNIFLNKKNNNYHTLKYRQLTELTFLFDLFRFFFFKK